MDHPSWRDGRSHALGGHWRDSGTALRTDHAERATDRDGRAAAARTRPGSLSLRTGRRCHPRWRHRRAGRSARCPLLDPQVAYLTGDQLCSTPFAAAFEVRQRLPFHLKALRHWVRQEQIGVLEIKKRGVDVDPAELRRRLRLAGPNSATMVISRTPGGAIAAIVERVCIRLVAPAGTRMYRVLMSG